MISSLLLHGDDAVGAHGRAEGAGDALVLVGHHRGGIALLIDLVLGYRQDVLGTGAHAQAAALAEVCLEGYFCHSITPFISHNG